MKNNTENKELVNNDYKLNFNPIYAGYYKIGGNIGMQISLGKKPKWIHRKLTKLLLGWEWKDNK
jgi:hypothetical protein